jgi:bacterioferritin
MPPRPAAEKGERPMNPQQVVALLNDDITAEVEATLVYMNHHFVVADPKVQLEMLETALEEMQHIQLLAEAIVGLGGAPELTPRKLRFDGVAIADALANGVMLEEEAIAGYRAHMAAIDDPLINAMLRRIMEEEELHLAEFAELLGDHQAGQAEKAPTVGDLTQAGEVTQAGE